MPVIHVKLTATEYAALEALLLQGGYKSRSDAIRDGLRAVFEAGNVDPETRRQMALERLVHFPRRRTTKMLNIDAVASKGAEAFRKESFPPAEPSVQVGTGEQTAAQGPSGGRAAGGSHTN